MIVIDTNWIYLKCSETNYCVQTPWKQKHATVWKMLLSLLISICIYLNVRALNIYSFIHTTMNGLEVFGAISKWMCSNQLSLVKDYNFISGNHVENLTIAWATLILSYEKKCYQPSVNKHLMRVMKLRENSKTEFVFEIWRCVSWSKKLQLCLKQ